MSSRPRLWIVAGLSLVLGVLCFAHRWLCDDGFIDLHVADNVLSGLGPVFNAGERVEAYTSPLWVAALVFLGAVTKPFSGGSLPPFEWISVWLGIACSMGAFAAACFGSLWLGGQEGGGSARLNPPIPIGGLLVLGIVAFWDFGTSGLESSLVLLWLALAFAALVRLREFPPDRPGRRLELLTGFWIGLGPLVRPDLGVFALLFLGLLIWLVPGWKRRASALLAVVLLPAAYELFRMGYFACLLPNTALAKEAGHTAWRRGWLYFLDFEITYQLWIPLVVLAAAEVSLLRRLWRERDRLSTALAAAPILGGLLHALYIVRVGGDFLHARMLLPALFALALPVFALPWSRARRFAAVLVPWAIACALFARIADDREHINLEGGRPDYVRMSGMSNPVTAADHRKLDWATTEILFRDIDRARANAPSGPGARTGFFSATMNVPLRAAALEPWSPARVEAVSYRAAIGIFGYQARQRVYVCDQYGLADPFVSRAEMPSDGGPRGKAGHEKGLSTDWCLARTVSALEGHDRYSAAVEYLRAALACGELRELNAAVIEPLSWRRFWRNVALAPRLTLLRVPHDPLEARQRFCG